MHRALYFSRFMPTPDMGGGSRRMLQIYEMLTAAVPKLQLLTTARGDAIPETVHRRIKNKSQQKNFLSPIRLSRSLRKWGAEHRTMVYRLRKFSEIWAGSLEELRRLDVAIMDDPIYFFPLFKKLQQLHVPVIAVCHNLETLVANQIRNIPAMDVFREELALLSKCRLVLTISREEDVLLNNLGIRTLHVPYYPVEPICRRLLAVRQKRVLKPKVGILMAGTAKNLPTRDGMERVARFWQQHHLEKTDGKLMVAGYQSESCFDACSYGDSVDFRGTLANEEMDDLLADIKAMLCYQENGAGALTRICEMLIAGVPVLANTHAARSFYNVHGVIEFRRLEDLPEVLRRSGRLNGEIPLPPVPDNAALQLEIQRTISRF